MIVIISDLHFVDETAGKHNISTPAFEKFLSNIRVHAVKAKAREVKIVFLGDIFDILRTEMWFYNNFDENDKPWGDNTVKMREKALEILKVIHEKNADTFALFNRSNNLRNVFGSRRKVESIYIPGNHDRLCWMIPELKKKVIEILDINEGNSANFKHEFKDVKHGLFATHGHCFDKYNYEGGSNRTLKDYGLMPIGDLITTELVAKLPYRLMKKIHDEGSLDDVEKKSLKRNFQEIENVRPFSATLKWLLYQVEANRHVKDIIEDTVDEIVNEFNKLKYVKKWYKRHDKWYKPLDTADKIQGVLYCLEKFKVFSTSKLLNLADDIEKLKGDDDLVKGASKLFSVLDNRIKYIVMGHTHTPLKTALSTNRDGNNLSEHVYLNTGTWRKRYHECRDASGFIGWKDMTYVIIYTPEEKPNKYNLPVFESWTGSLKRKENNNPVTDL